MIFGLSTQTNLKNMGPVSTRKKGVLVLNKVDGSLKIVPKIVEASEHFWTKMPKIFENIWTKMPNF